MIQQSLKHVFSIDLSVVSWFSINIYIMYIYVHIIHISYIYSTELYTHIYFGQESWSCQSRARSPGCEGA